MKTAKMIPLDAAVAGRLGRSVNSSLDCVQEARIRINRGDVQTADGVLMEAQETLQAARQTMLTEGLVNLDGVPDQFFTLAPPTDAEERLLQAVAEAREIAYEVARERGEVLLNGMLCGMADTFDDLYYRLRVQIKGPEGCDE